MRKYERLGRRVRDEEVEMRDKGGGVRGERGEG